MANLLEKKGMCENLQIVCSIDDLRQLFGEWQAEQRERESLEREQQTKKEEYLTADEACRLLSVTKPTLWRWAQIKYLVPVKVGRKNYYRVADIDALRKG